MSTLQETGLQVGDPRCKDHLRSVKSMKHRPVDFRFRKLEAVPGMGIEPGQWLKSREEASRQSYRESRVDQRKYGTRRVLQHGQWPRSVAAIPGWQLTDPRTVDYTRRLVAAVRCSLLGKSQTTEALASTVHHYSNHCRVCRSLATMVPSIPKLPGPGQLHKLPVSSPASVLRDDSGTSSTLYVSEAQERRKFRQPTLILARSTPMSSAKPRFVCVVGFGFFRNDASRMSTSSFPSRGRVSVFFEELGIAIIGAWVIVYVWWASA